MKITCLVVLYPVWHLDSQGKVSSQIHHAKLQGMLFRLNTQVYNRVHYYNYRNYCQLQMLLRCDNQQEKGLFI